MQFEQRSVSKFETRRVFTFYEHPQYPWKVQLSVINGLPYVGITKYYLMPRAGDFVPTKTNCFMPLQVFFGLVHAIPTISAAIKQGIIRILSFLCEM